MSVKNIGTNMNLLPKIPCKYKIAGFTLIEILIAMLILSVGLLGLAGFQATSLRNNTSAYNRSQATQLAYDLSDRVRANVAGATTYTSGSASAVANCATTTGCTPAQMAQNDLFEWNQAVDNIFPINLNTITVSGSTFTISIRWDEDISGAIDTGDPTFTVDFQL